MLTTHVIGSKLLFFFRKPASIIKQSRSAVFGRNTDIYRLVPYDMNTRHVEVNMTKVAHLRTVADIHLTCGFFQFIKIQTSWTRGDFYQTPKSTAFHWPLHFETDFITFFLKYHICSCLFFKVKPKPNVRHTGPKVATKHQ